MRPNVLNKLPLLLLAALVIQVAPVRAADVIEKLRGSRLKGTIVAETDSHFTMQVRLRGSGGSGSLQMNVSKKSVHAVTIKGQRRVINPRVARSPRKRPLAKTRESTRKLPAVKVIQKRSREEVLALIEKVGSTKPKWFDATRLDYPKALDLSWPDAGKHTWNNKMYVGHYVWDVINPNQSSWRRGIKFLHYVKFKNKDNSRANLKILNQLGTMYGNLEEDWPRAAYWWREAGRGLRGERGTSFKGGYHVGLAKCYWKLGNKAMAVEEMEKENWKNSSAANMWAIMGEYDRALAHIERVAKWYEGFGGRTYFYIVSGDICVEAGWYKKAIKHYQYVLDHPLKKPLRWDTINIQTAKDRILTIKAFETLNLKSIPDGTYTDSQMGYNGPIHISVTLKRSRITSVKVTRHTEKQFYSSITDTTTQIVQKQGFKDVDITSGASLTSKAIVSATAKALVKRMR